MQQSLGLFTFLLSCPNQADFLCAETHILYVCCVPVLENQAILAQSGEMSTDPAIYIHFSLNKDLNKMRYLISCLLITLLSLGLFVNEASAKRFGSGRSFGVQRSQSSLFSSQRAPANAALGQRTSGSKWGGMLGGLLVGGLLASLFMGNGLTSGILSWLMLGVVAFLIINFIRKRMQPGMQTAQASSFQQNSFRNFTQNVTNAGSSSSGDTPTNAYPQDFDAEQFLRNAKVTFIRLQAAYDQKNIEDLTAFTAPEVFGEIKMQLDERGDMPNKTDVINLNAELLDVSNQVDSTIASVRFTGSIKEDDEPVTQLNEIWHFRQFGNNKQWVVGGIQQDMN